MRAAQKRPYFYLYSYECRQYIFFSLEIFREALRNIPTIVILNTCEPKKFGKFLIFVADLANFIFEYRSKYICLLSVGQIKTDNNTSENTKSKITKNILRWQVKTREAGSGGYWASRHNLLLSSKMQRKRPG